MMESRRKLTRSISYKGIYLYYLFIRKFCGIHFVVKIWTDSALLAYYFGVSEVISAPIWWRSEDLFGTYIFSFPRFKLCMSKGKNIFAIFLFSNFLLSRNYEDYVHVLFYLLFSSLIMFSHTNSCNSVGILMGQWYFSIGKTQKAVSAIEPRKQFRFNSMNRGAIY